jgi:hypothetical protein
MHNHRPHLNLVHRLIFASLFVLATHVASAGVVVDDFSSGAFSSSFSATPAGNVVADQEAGTMAAGMRQWSLLLAGNDLGAQVDISAAGFDFRSALGVGHRFDWIYGETYVGHDHAMNLDFSSEDTLRFSFADAPRGLNFNVLLYFRDQVDNYAQLGVNLLPSAEPFNVDFRLSNFASAIADRNRPADFSRVSGIYIVTQSGGYFAGGGEGFRITRIEALNAVPEPTGLILALTALGAAGLAGRRRDVQPGSRSLPTSA